MGLAPGVGRRAARAALVLLAVGGYLIGHHAWSRGGHPTAMRSLIIANVLVEYPDTWRRSTNVAIPDVSLTEAVALAPNGGAGQSGLLVGSLPSGESGPLPRALLSALAARPRTDIVNLAETQAYRYTGVSIAAFAGSLTVYTIPAAAGHATLAVCYARRDAEAFIGICNRVVAGLTQLGQAQSFDLVPDATYAHRLAAAISGVDGLRVLDAAAFAGASAGSAAAGEVQRRGGELAARFSSASAAVAALEPPAPVVRAHAALLRALSQASSAYATLAAAAAAGRGGSSEVLRARAPVRAAEAAVNEALEGFSLLGYGPGS
jgi:hypothetical protein